MKLLLDAHLSPFITHCIEDNFEIECVSFHHLTWQTTEDEEAFLKAKEMNAIVLTKDEDFIGLLKKHKAPPKIIWLTCGNTSNKRLKEILSSKLNEALELLLVNDLVEISD
jgi:predicted nuclease of predicted toxin-antitoxin system